MSQAVITLIVLAVMAVGFVTEILPLAVISIGGAFVLSLFGIVQKTDVFSAASGSTCILLAATMIIGGAIFHSGLADKLSKKIVRVTGTTENGIMLATMFVALTFSSVCSGTSVVAMMLPIVIAMSMQAGVSISRQMIVLSFASSIGCNLTLVGAASNVSTAGMIEEMGIDFLSFFELGKVGLPLCIAFAVYFMTIGKKTLRNPRPVNREYLDDLVATSGGEAVFSKKKAAITAVILIITFAAMAADNKSFPMYYIAALGCLILILTGCLTTKEAARAVDWDTIFIVTGMSAVTKAMTASGAGAMIANAVTRILGFIPIAVSIGMNPVAAGVAICVGASSPFLTPVGSPTNTLVVKPGNLQFMDFFIPGLGLTILSVVISMIVIPIFWPL